MAEKSHRQKIEEFNKKLDQLSEHYDIPKVKLLFFNTYFILKGWSWLNIIIYLFLKKNYKYMYINIGTYLLEINYFILWIIYLTLNLKNIYNFFNSIDIIRFK